jgi:DNA ligase-1
LRARERAGASTSVPLTRSIHQPKLRLGITSTKLKSYLEDKFERETRAHEIDESPETLLQLLHALPTLSGNALREAVACFLYNHGVWECTESEDDAQYAAAELGGETPFQTFTRLIDRSLNGGWGLNTLKLAWPEGVSEAAPKLVKVKAAAVEKKGALENKAATENKAVTGNKASASVAKKDKGEKVTKAKTKTKAASAAESEAAAPPPAATHHPIKVSLKEFKVALGKTITPPFHELFKSKTPQTWYASRKLDGVRCITLIDVLVPKSAKQPLSIEGMSFLSRSGNEFTSLDNLHGPLEAIATLQELRKWLDTDPVVVDTIPNGEIKRLVLDGEVCVLRKDGTDFVEDFHSVVSQVRRKNDQVLNPAYFLLDVLPWNEFEGPLSAQPSTFYDRHSHALAVAKHCDTRAVKCLEQWRVTTPANVEEMAQRAMENEWEGLVFRLDAVYKGKRR